MDDLLVVVLNYNTHKITIDCLKSVLDKKWHIKLKVVVVDNASTDGSVEKIKKEFPEIEVLKNKKNVGFARGNNTALRKYYKSYKYSLLLNSDTLVKSKALDKLLCFARENNTGITSCMLKDVSGKFQANGGNLPKPLAVFSWISNFDDIFKLPSYQERSKKYFKKERNIGWVSGTVMLIKKEVIDKIGFMDEKIFMYGEDVDYCWRARKAGFKIGWTNEAVVTHIGGASSSSPRYVQWLGEFKGLLYLYKKHYGNLAVLWLKILMYKFILLRSIAFFIIGKKDYAKTYTKILKNI